MYYPQLNKNVTVFTNTDQQTEKEDAMPDSVSDDGAMLWGEDSLKEVMAAAPFAKGDCFIRKTVWNRQKS